MRKGMVRFGHADLRIRPRALLLADHERDHARQIRLEGQHLQVEHQGQVILEHRRHALRLVHRRQIEIALLFRLLDAALDVAHRFGVLVDLRLILGPERLAQAGQLVVDRIENALVLAEPRFARGAVGAAAVAEQFLEHRARVELHRQRLRLAAPRQGVRVDAAEIAGAGAGVVRRIHRQFERSQLGLAREMPRQQLIHRDIGDDLDLVPSAPRRAGQKRSRCAGVNVVPVGLEARQHQHLVAKWRERLEDRRHLEAGAGGFRQPVLHRHPVGDVEGLEALHRRGRARDRRCHRIQQRQRQRRAQPTQNGASCQRFRGQQSHEDPRITKAGLLTIPIISDDQR